MMDFDMQLIVALFVSLVIVYPIHFNMAKKYRKEGKSVKKLYYKLAIIVMMPILSIPILLNVAFSPLDKIIVILLMIVAGVTYLYGIDIIRKLLGLPSEDEHMEKADKEDKKRK